MRFNLIAEDNTQAVLAYFTKALKSRITATSVKNELDKHPEPQSLLAISDLLNKWQVDTAAFKIAPADLHKLPLPFVAHTNINGGEFVCVTGINNRHVEISNQNYSRHKIPYNQFVSSFTGVILTAESNENSGESNYLQKHRIEKLAKARIFALPVLFVVLSALAIYGFSPLAVHFNMRQFLVVVINLAGLAVSSLLLIQSIYKSSPLIQKLCGSKENCNSIITSQAAIAFWGISWAEIGCAYFAGSFLFMLFAANSVQHLAFYAVINTLVLPYTFYSIYYQYRVVRQWCRLCLIVQIFLWCGFALSVSAILQLNNFSTTFLTSFFLSYGFPVLTWFSLKPFIYNVQKIKPLTRQLYRFKYNQHLFLHALQAQTWYEQPQDDACIRLGNADAENVITLVSNPYCPPCAKAHAVLMELRKSKRNTQLRLVFMADGTESDRKTHAVKHFLALKQQQGETQLETALTDWYAGEKTDFINWAKRYPIDGTDIPDDKINRQKQWCNYAGIKATPTLFVNGYKLPELYRVEDLDYILN